MPRANALGTEKIASSLAWCPRSPSTLGCLTSAGAIAGSSVAVAGDKRGRQEAAKGCGDVGMAPGVPPDADTPPTIAPASK